MTDRPHSVIESVTLPSIIHYILENHRPCSMLVVCCSRKDFVDNVRDTVVKDSHDPNTANESVESSAEMKDDSAFWLRPTLRTLAASRTLELAFCPQLPVLRAFLATYPQYGTTDTRLDSVKSPSNHESRILAILNPVEVHRQTTAFSTQGLNRTFAAAVEAADRSASRLIMAEIPFVLSQGSTDEVMPPLDATATGISESDKNVWDEEISILNTTTKSFGAGERGWVGRTVAIRRVAGRWCEFARGSDLNS